MKRYTLSALPMFLALLAACGGDSTGPGDRIANLAIAPAPPPTIQVGGTLQLTVTLTNSSGGVVTGQNVTWTSGTPGVATVSTTGLVTGIAAGTADITASAGGAQETVTVNVAPPPSQQCDPANTINLAVGETFVASGGGAALLCVAGGPGSEYVYVPFHHSGAGAARLAVEVSAGGVTAAAGPPTPFLSPSAGLSLSAAPVEPRRDLDWELRLREREIRELTPLLPGARAEMARRASSGALRALMVETPAEGSLITLNANPDQACSNPNNRTGRVVAVTQRAIVVVDTTNPPSNVTDAEYRSFGQRFDDFVWPIDTRNFGEPSDIDDNNRVVIFYTRVVNELTGADATSFVAGFFFGRDLFPRTGTSPFGTCATSNEREMFYLLAPDPNGVINGNKRTEDQIRRSTVSVTLHEFQHLINQSRRMYVNNSSSLTEDVWLNEGLSHIAEELGFYEASGLAPRQNITIEQLRQSQAALDAFNTYQISNLSRYINYLEGPEDTQVLDTEASDGLEIDARGAAWALLRYAADRKSGPDQPFWFGLVNADNAGLANLQTSINADPLVWARQWTTSTYTDDAVPGIPSEVTLPSWNHRSLVLALRNSSGNQVYSQYPLETFPLTGATLSFRPFAGTGAFVRFGVPANGLAAVRATSGGVAPPASLRVTLVRTK